MADPTIFSYSLQDDEGLKSSTDFYVAYDGLTMTEAIMQSGWLVYGGLLDAVTDAKILGGAITIPVARDGTWKANPIGPGNNVNQVMNLNFNNDFNSYATSILIPAYRESILTPTLVPDLADAALAAFISAIIAGEGGALFPNSRDLHDLNALRDAFLTVRKVRNQKSHTIVSP